MRRWFLFGGTALMVGFASGCQYLQFLGFLKRPVQTGAQGRRLTEHGPAFQRSRAATGVSPDSEWRSYNHDFTTAQRHSPLTEITPANVAALRPVCTAELGERVPMQAGPIVVAGTIYLTSAVSTWALDASTCEVIWKHRYEYAPRPSYDLRVNRGVAWADTPEGGCLVRGANDGRVYALDAATGEEVWNVLAGDVAKGETFPAAPVSWGGLAYIGNAGGDNYAVTGRIMAFDVRTGATVWRAELVPRAGERAFTWPPERDEVPRAGATTWTTYTLDTLARELFVPTGNSAPLFLPSVREGSNDHAYSVVVLDARLGTIRQAHRITPGDFHDWDMAAAPLLVRSKGGQSLVIAAGKDGWLHALDRASGRRMYRTAITTIENAEAPLTAEGTRFCPGVQGGVEWNGPSYDPARSLLFVGAVDWCTTVRVQPPAELEGKKGIPWTGSAELTEPFGKMDPKERARGWLTAVDAESGEVRWRMQAATPLVAGVTSTASGLVFTADLLGNVMAVDASTGRELFRHNTGQPVGGGVITYVAGGRQLVAVASGLHAPLTWQRESAPAKVVVFGLR